MTHCQLVRRQNFKEHIQNPFTIYKRIDNTRIPVLPCNYQLRGIRGTGQRVHGEGHGTEQGMLLSLDEMMMTIFA